LIKDMTRATLALAGASCLAMTSRAGAEVETLIGPQTSGSIAAGWDSRYFFRGRWFGDEAAWANVELSHELSPKLTGSLNLFFTEVTDDRARGAQYSFSEANIGATLSYDAGYGFFDLTFLHNRFFDGFAGSFDGQRLAGVAGNGDASEVSLGFSKTFSGDVRFYAQLAHDFRIDGSYAELGLSKEWKLRDGISLGFGVSSGYSIDDYYSESLGNGDDDRGFTHTRVSLALPMALTETATFTPYLAANFSHGAREESNALVDRDDTELFYGASLSVSF